MRNLLCTHNYMYYKQKTCVLYDVVWNFAYVILCFGLRCGLVTISQSSYRLVIMYIKILCQRIIDPQYLSGLPLDLVAGVALCCLQQITKDLRKNVVEEAWLMLLQPYSELVIREMIGHSNAGGHGNAKTPSRLEKLVSESMISLIHQECLWIKIL